MKTEVNELIDYLADQVASLSKENALLKSKIEYLTGEQIHEKKTEEAK
ncbi:hypothetical protein ACFPU1_14450 [Thalassorhabdus alkalitolerans]|uniref:Transposase n=1 Tax=Thalassorhabdus alkalitolerans TaxID=2282697 RepID=A0ABW0YRG5_9BACI|nr:hypothetical protein [Thalassobacillus sp. C254]